RANIIAPIPKVSPPLRSSRPRQPISSASTAASRGKVVEKINAMTNQSNSASRQRRPLRPPELKNIDLEARRHKITQAFNKTVQENERRKEIRRAQARQEESATAGKVPLQIAAPAIVVEQPSQQEGDEDVFQTPVEEHDQLEHDLKLRVPAHSQAA